MTHGSFAISPDSNNPRLKVLFIIPGPSGGTSMIHAKREVEHLSKAGIWGKIFFLKSRTSPLVLLSELSRIRKEIRNFEPDLIHAEFGTMTAFFGAISSNLPMVITYRGSDLNPTSGGMQARALVGRLLSQFSALSADRIICVSRQLRERLWWKRRKAVVIPTGVDIEIFFPIDKEQARRTLSWGVSNKTVLFHAGKESENKRLDMARAAIKFAEATCGPIQFVVLDGSVPANTIPFHINGADCLLVTSDREGSPTIVQEALACNLPIVSVDVGDVRDRLKGVTSSYVVSRSANEIGKAVATVLQRGGRSNGRLAAKEVALSKLTAEILSVYRAALS